MAGQVDEDVAAQLNDRTLNTARHELRLALEHATHARGLLRDDIIGPGVQHLVAGGSDVLHELREVVGKLEWLTSDQGVTR